MAGPLDHRGQPPRVRLPGAVQPQVPGLQGRHPQGRQRARARVHRGEVQQPQVAPVPLMAGNALVVVDAVPAAVQDQLAPEHLDRAGVVRGMTVDEIDAAADQPVRESGIPIPTPR